MGIEEEEKENVSLRRGAGLAASTSYLHADNAADINVPAPAHASHKSTRFAAKAGGGDGKVRLFNCFFGVTCARSFFFSFSFSPSSSLSLLL